MTRALWPNDASKTKSHARLAQLIITSRLRPLPVKPFHTIAVPHEDIVQSRLTMDVYAADLWDTFQGRAPEDYTDPTTFFKKTHVTANLDVILEGVRGRLAGKGGDGFQHVETPFGGGKTHALIAMYHKAREWGAKCVVIVGTAMGPEDTVWGEIEKQLDGRLDTLSGKLAPGREKIRHVLERHSPVLILIDELLPYATVASGVNINKTDLAAQTITFIQQLSEAVSSLSRVCVVASFPTSESEMADKRSATSLLTKIRKVSGRKEKKIAPVNPSDIPSIIRARLFSSTDAEIRGKSSEVISPFVDYCKKESILPSNHTSTEYRKKFEETYPFLPEVIDVLYHNWGSFPSFQRTRGVLRLLSQVVHSLKDGDRPYISLSDFDLNNDEMRRELLGHIGGEFDSVVSKDITDSDSGAKRADIDVGESYRGLHLGTKSAVTIFMYSFTNGGTNGANLNEIKRAACDIGTPSSAAGEVASNFKSKMSYIRNDADRYFFTSVPNINRLKIDRMEAISDSEMLEGEKIILSENIGRQKINTRVWPSSPSDIDDSPSLKLVIMPEDDVNKCTDLIESKGDVPRIYRNSILFLCPSEAGQSQFITSLKSKIALKNILSERTNLKPEQRKDVVNELKDESAALVHLLRKCYRNVYIPGKNGLEKCDMGIPVVGNTKGIADQVFETLKLQQEVHERIGALVIREEFLTGQDYAKTSMLYRSMLSMRGSRRPIDETVVKDAIEKGVLQKTFGLGILVDGSPACQHFGNECQVEFAGNEVIINASLCEETITDRGGGSDGSGETSAKDNTNEQKNVAESVDLQKALVIEFDLPVGKLSDILGVLQLINIKFRAIHFTIDADGGSMTDDDMTKITDALKQAHVRHSLKVPTKESSPRS